MNAEAEMRTSDGLGGEPVRLDPCKQIAESVGYDAHADDARLDELIDYKNALEDALRRALADEDGDELAGDRVLGAVVDALGERVEVPVTADEIGVIDRDRFWNEIGGPAVDWLETHITAQEIERRDLLLRLARGGYSLDESQMLDVIGLEGPATAAEVEDAAVAKLRELGLDQ
jgi:hypothetical protein